MPAEGGGRSDRQTPEESSWEGPAHSPRLGLPHQLFLKSPFLTETRGLLRGFQDPSDRQLRPTHHTSLKNPSFNK